MIKKREGYRPFAPSVLEERAADYFELPPGQSKFPYMIFVLKVRPEARTLLQAITHVNGTARVQTVSRQTAPRYWALIQAFGERTGVPMLLNTSFNNHAEPIVDSVDDAITCFLTTELTHLVIEDVLVERRAGLDLVPAIEALIPIVPDARRLAVTSREEAPTKTRKICVLDRVFTGAARASRPISFALFGILAQADPQTPLGDLLDRAALHDGERTSILLEVLELWSERLLSLTPHSTLSM